MVDISMKKKQSAHFFSHMIKVGFAVLALTFGVLGFCVAPAAAGYSVNNVEINNLALPAVGDNFGDYGYALVSKNSLTPSRIVINTDSVNWYKGDSLTPLEDTDIRLANIKYTVEFEIPLDGLTTYTSFDESVTVYFYNNYGILTESEVYQRTSDSLLKVRHTFLIPIENIVISNITPVIGTPLKTDLKITGDDVIRITDYTINWYDSDYTTEYPEDTISQGDSTYIAKLYIKTPDGYLINSKTRYIIDDPHSLMLDCTFDSLYLKFTISINPKKVQIQMTPIPDRISHGEILTVSGTGFPGEMVVVDLISTAFVGAPIESFPEKSHLYRTSIIDSDGLWVVSLDTAYVNPDDYTCRVGGYSDLPLSSRIIVVGESYPEKPTESPQPTQKPTTEYIVLKCDSWNFISIPSELSSEHNTAADVFIGVNTNNNAILTYNAKDQKWEQVFDNTVIVPLNAYWIYSVDDEMLPVTFNIGAHVPASKAVYKGWNAVGISAEKPMTAADAFNNINWRTYLIWNPTIQKYDTTIIKGNKAEYSEDTFINLWKGGWLFMDEDNTIIGYA